MKGLLFIYAFTYGGAVAALLDPFVGLLIYVAFAILRPEDLWFWSVPQGNYSRTVALALLAGWAARGFGSWRFGRSRDVVLLLVGFWMWSAASAAQAPNQTVAWDFVEKISKIILPFLVGITTVDSVKRLKMLTWTVVLSQAYVALDFNIYYICGYNKLMLSGLGPLDNNFIAAALVTCLGMSLGIGLSENVWWRKGLALGTSILMMHAILFSSSRGGMLGLILTGLITFVFMPKQPKSYLTAAVCLVLVLRLAGPAVQQRFSEVFADESGRRDESAESRLALWSDCWDVMKKEPIFGAGPEHWPLIAADYGWMPGKEAHSLWLAIGSELGFPGLAFLALFYLVCMVRLVPLARGGANPPDAWLHHGARMVIASLAGFGLSAQFISARVLEQPYYVALVGAGILKIASAPGRDREVFQ